MAKNPPANAGDIRDMGLIPGLGRSPGEGNNNPSQYSCLENSMDRGAWQITVPRVAKSWTQLSMHACNNKMYHTRDYIIILKSTRIKKNKEKNNCRLVISIYICNCRVAYCMPFIYK